MLLITSTVLLVGCASIPSEERKPFSARLVDLIAYNLRGGKTQEEYDREMAAEKYRAQAAQEEWERVRREK
jgi:hypothetical protein